jgi:hypothetical protein
MRTGMYVRSRGGLDVLRQGRVRGDGAGGDGTGRGRGGGGILRRSRDPKREASWSFFVLRLKGQLPVMASLWGRRRWLRPRARTFLIKALAARRPAWSSRHRALMVGADGQVRHQCLTDDALDEAEAMA